MKETKSGFTTDSLQFITIDRNGTVISSDQQVIQVETGSLIQNYHPFFNIIEAYVDQDIEDNKLECVHIDDKTVDIEIIVKNKNTIVIILNDCTAFYKKIQFIAQKKNESIIFSEILQLKNNLLKEQEEFKNKFLGNFSHELRNPLTLITSFSSILLKTDLNLDQERLINAINEQGEKLKMILDDIIDISIMKNDIISLDKKIFSIRKLIENIHSNYSTVLINKPLKLFSEIEPTIPKNIIGDKRRIEQIITSFIDNAIQHNENGEKITLKLKENQRRANKISLRIEVVSNSQHIKEIISPLNETFRIGNKTDFEKNVGLSFSIARELAQIMEGNISIKHTDDLKTVQIANIKTSFPIHDREAIEVDSKKIKNKKELVLSDKIKTIIAEDNSVTQMTLLKILVRTGNFDTQIFTNPEELLKTLSNQEYDLILMSSSISHVDALELIKLIREFSNDYNKKIPIIAVSSKTKPQDIALYKKAGFKDVVKKPYTDDELLNTIYKRLNLKKFK